ncbi:MAG: hypothetical protein L6Q40_05285 [Azonexus sp.]|nr:hypothetical protein [Azonexus sp.]
MLVGHNGAGIAEQMNSPCPGWQANDSVLSGIGFFYSSTPGELVSMIGGALLGKGFEA